MLLFCLRSFNFSVSFGYLRLLLQSFFLSWYFWYFIIQNFFIAQTKTFNVLWKAPCQAKQDKWIKYEITNCFIKANKPATEYIFYIPIHDIGFWDKKFTIIEVYDYQIIFLYSIVVAAHTVAISIWGVGSQNLHYVILMITLILRALTSLF